MVYVFLSEGLEEIEAIAPIDLLRRAGAEVTTVSTAGSVVMGAHGIMIAADMVEEDLKSFNGTEMIVLPGGMPGTLNEEKSDVVQAAIDYCCKNNIPIGAICAAPSILGHKGILKGKSAVCYPGFEQELQGADVCYEGVITDGNITTARGAGVAIEFGLELIRVLCGEEKSWQVRTAVISK